MSALADLRATLAPPGPVDRALRLRMSRSRYMGEVAKLPCLLCLELGHTNHEVHVHHRRAGVGFGRASDFDTIPLCPEHHQGKTGIHGMGTKAFAREYGVTEGELVEIAQGLVWIATRHAEV